MESLQGLVEKLEGGDLPLEEAIDRFEEGRKLHRELLAELDTYERRLEKVLAEPEDQAQGNPVAPDDREDQGPGDSRA